MSFIIFTVQRDGSNSPHWTHYDLLDDLHANGVRFHDVYWTIDGVRHNAVKIHGDNLRVAEQMLTMVPDPMPMWIIDDDLSVTEIDHGTVLRAGGTWVRRPKHESIAAQLATPNHVFDPVTALYYVVRW